MHWFYALLSAVQELSTYSAEFQCTSVTTSVSSHEAVTDDLGCAAYSSSIDDFPDLVVLVSSHHTQQAPNCACIGVLQ